MADKITIQAGAGDSQAFEWTRSNYGIAALNVHERALSTLRAQEQHTPSLYLDVNPGLYRYGSTIVLFVGGISPVFSPPVAGTRLDVLYLDCATRTLTIVEGIAATAITDELALPEIPDQAIPLVAVHLAADQASITEADLYDMRPFLTADLIPWAAGADGEALLSDGGGGAAWSLPIGLLHASAQSTSGSTYSQDSSTWTTIRSLASVTLTKACRVCLQAQAIGYTGSAGNPVEIQICQGDTALGYPSQQPATSYSPLMCVYDYNLPAGTYTWNLKYRRNGGSGTVYVAYIVFNVKAFTME